MRPYLLVFPFVFCTAASAADTDTVCATVYTYLSESARSSGVSNSGFEVAAFKAQQMHLASNPSDDPGRYQLSVIDGAQTIRDALARGTISSDAVIQTATGCNKRYSNSD